MPPSARPAVPTGAPAGRRTADDRLTSKQSQSRFRNDSSPRRRMWRNSASRIGKNRRPLCGSGSGVCGHPIRPVRRTLQSAGRTARLACYCYCYCYSNRFRTPQVRRFGLAHTSRNRRLDLRRTARHHRRHATAHRRSGRRGMDPARPKSRSGPPNPAQQRNGLEARGQIRLPMSGRVCIGDFSTSARRPFYVATACPTSVRMIPASASACRSR